MTDEELKQIEADVAALAAESKKTAARNEKLDRKEAGLPMDPNTVKLIEIERSALRTGNFDAKALAEGRAIVVEDKPKPGVVVTVKPKSWNNDKGYWVRE